MHLKTVYLTNNIGKYTDVTCENGTKAFCVLIIWGQAHNQKQHMKWYGFHIFRDHPTLAGKANVCVICRLSSSLLSWWPDKTFPTYNCICNEYDEHYIHSPKVSSPQSELGSGRKKTFSWHCWNLQFLIHETWWLVLYELHFKEI